MDCRINHITLKNFKNYGYLDVEFHPGLNAILGLNGVGKTNLLDAIYYTCLGKSYFSSGDRQVLKKGEDYIRIVSKIEVGERSEKFIAKIQPGKNKELSIDGKKVEKISDHVGRYPVTIVAPDDITLLLEGSEPRRKFLNHNLIQYDTSYALHLIKYNRLLKQRNVLLKSFAERQKWDESLLMSITEQMEEPSLYIKEKREELVKEMIPIFTENYAMISGNRETCEIIYKSQLIDLSFLELMESHMEKDRILQRSTAGIHKDDLQFNMNGELLKPFGSQGQLKSFILSLKLAQYQILKQRSGKTPILILDDVFDKLDGERVSHLLQILHDQEYGQVFLTDKDEEDIPAVLEQISDDYAIFVIDEGSLKYRSQKG